MTTPPLREKEVKKNKVVFIFVLEHSNEFLMRKATTKLEWTDRFDLKKVSKTTYRWERNKNLTEKFREIRNYTTLPVG